MLKYFRENAVRILVVTISAFVLSMIVIGWQSNMYNRNEGRNRNQQQEGVFATYKGEEINFRKYRNVLQQNSAPYQNEKIMDPFLSMYINYRSLQDVFSFLAYLDAADKRNIKVKNSEVKYNINAMKKNYKMSNKEFKQMVKRNGFTMKELKEDIRDDIKVKKYLSLIESLSNVSESELKDMYTRVNASHILISIAKDADKEVIKAKKDLIDSLYERAKKGSDFGVLAKENSDDPGSKLDSGSLGWFKKGVMVPEFEKVAFSIEKEEISKPFRSEYGYHIIKLNEREEGEIPLDADIDELKKQFKKQKKENLFYEDLGKLEDISKIHERSLLAYEYRLRGEYQKAFALFNLLLSENPNSPVLHLFVADVLERQDKFSEAKKEYDKAVLKERVLKQQNPFIHFYLAKLHIKQKRKKSAAKELKLAEEASQDSITILRRIAKEYKDMGYTKSSARIDSKIEKIELTKELEKQKMDDMLEKSETQATGLSDLEIDLTENIKLN